MAYKPVDRSFDSNYLKQQHQAMRWLAEQGLTAEEIREFHWGNVLATENTLRVTKEIVSIKLDVATGLISAKQTSRDIMIPLSGTPCKHFFLKSRIWCHWAFLKERPRTWRREGSRESLYSLSEVEKICCTHLTEVSNDGVLTNVLKFATMGLSKLNITKMKDNGGDEGEKEAQEAIIV